MGSWKRRIAAVAPTPDGGAEEWRRHPRLQRHLTRFCAKENQEGVLNRYWRKAAGVSDQEPPYRDMTHVAAWVALLPFETTLLPDCARVLSLFLRRHPCGARSETSRKGASSGHLLWLRGTLHLVARRLKELRAEAPGGLAEHWLDLQRSMPWSVWRTLRASCPAIASIGKEAERRGAVDEGAHHAVDAHAGREAEVKAVLQEAAASLEAGDAGRMLKAVIEAAASLSAPRRATVQGEGAETMTEAALDRLRAAQQSRLREALLRLLDEGLDLSDPGTLQLLRAPLEKLKSLLRGQCLSSVAHADQWLALARVIGVPHGDLGVTLLLDASHSSGSPKSQTPGLKKMAPGRRHPGLKRMALAAMANLGGQATSKQLREEMGRMPESLALSSETCPESPGVTLWEFSVRSNMPSWFERTETPRVFRLQGSADSASHVAWSNLHKKKCWSQDGGAHCHGQLGRPGDQQTTQRGDREDARELDVELGDIEQRTRHGAHTLAHHRRCKHAAVVRARGDALEARRCRRSRRQEAPRDSLETARHCYGPITIPALWDSFRGSSVKIGTM